MNVNEQFEKDVELLVATKELLPLETRIQQVTDLTEKYFEETGKHYGNTFFLDMLGTYLLADDLRNKNTHKVKLTEYPVLSHTQQKLRNRRESRVGDENLDFIVMKVVKQNPNSFRKKTQNLDDVRHSEIGNR